MLHEAISEISGQEIPEVNDTQIDLPINAFIPATWILNREEKLEAYKSATECSNNDELKNFDTDKIPLTKTILLGFSQGAAMAIDAGFKLNFGLIVACSGYPHPNWSPGEKFSPLIISHGLFDEVVPIDASRNIYEKVKSSSSKFCEF